MCIRDRGTGRIKSSRIRKYYREAGLDNEDEWDEIQEWMLSAWIRLDKAFRPRIANLKL